MNLKLALGAICLMACGDEGDPKRRVRPRVPTTNPTSTTTTNDHDQHDDHHHNHRTRHLVRRHRR